MTELIVIRHGETDYNRQQRFQGQVDVPLNPIGHAQASRLAERLRGQAPEHFIVSDLLRTRQTAAPLAEAWGLQPEASPLWREQSFGVIDGLDVPTIKREHAPLWALWLEQRADFQLPGGESLRQFHDRVIGALQQIAEQHRGRRIAIVSHGGVLDMLWRHAQGLPLDGLRRCEIPNTGINRLRLQGDRLLIEQWADAAHLEGLPEQPSTAAGER